MSDYSSPGSVPWPPSLARRLDAVCLGFEAAWKSGPEPPRLEDYLDDLPDAARGPAFGELLALELAYRLRRGEHPTEEEYDRRFPEQRTAIQAVFAETAGRSSDSRGEIGQGGSPSEAAEPVTAAEVIASPATDSQSGEAGTLAEASGPAPSTRRPGGPVHGPPGGSRALEQESGHFWALYLRALCRLRAGRWELAQGDLTACLSQRPDFYWARLLRATAESQLGDTQPNEYRNAEEDFAAALRRAEEPAARWVLFNNRGAMWRQRGLLDKAIDDFREAIRLRPEAPEPYISLASVYRVRKDWDSALAALDQALARRPGDAGLYHTRAELHLARGDPAAARRDFDQAIACEPPGSTSERLATDLVERGRLRHQAGQHEAALASFDDALRIQKDYPPAYRFRAETLLALGRYQEAGEALDRFLLKGQPTAKVYQVRGLIHAGLHDYAAAVDAYSRSLALRRDAATLAYRGWAYLKLDAHRLAAADFDAALRLDPAQTDALCGDGKPDLVASNFANSTVSVLLGDSTGAFPTQMTLPTVQAPVATLVADVNGDGRPDLVITSDRDSSVGVLLGRGNGSFNQLTAAGGAAPRNTPFLVDLDNDGIPDSVILDRSGNILFRKGLPNGQLAPPPPQPPNAGRPARDLTVFRTGKTWAIATADASFDPTLSGPNHFVYTVSVYAYGLDGAFHRTTAFSTTFLPTRIAAADLLGNGLDDLIVADSLDNRAQVAFQFPDGSFAPPVTLATEEAPSDIALVDVDHDGLPDIVVSNQASGDVSVFLNRGDRSFAGPFVFRAGTGPYGIDTTGAAPAVRPC